MSQDPSSPPPRRGRPPSEASRRKALSAAHDFLMQEGFGRLTIEAVAARSGVGKPTIYRHWANASELALAALMMGVTDAPAPVERPLAEALGTQLHALVQAFATTRGRQIALALAAADPESEMTRAFRNRVILSSREAGRDLIAAALKRSEIAPLDDTEIVLDMIYAPLVYRLLAAHQPLDKALADALTRQAMRLLEYKE